MKYALEYDPTDQNTFIIHFDKELLECPSQELSEKDMSGGITFGCMTHRENNTIVDDGENNKDKH